MIGSDGQSVWFHDIVSVVRESGEPVTLSGFMIDISARKRVEETLQELSARLIHAQEEERKREQEIVAAQANVGDGAGAEKIFELAVQVAGTFSLLRNKAQALQAIAVAQAKVGNQAAAAKTFEQAIETAAKMTDTWFERRKSWTLRDIAVAQAEVGDVVEARQTAVTIKGYLAKTRALAAIAVIQANAGDVAGARETAASIPKPFSLFRFSSSSTTQPLLN